MTGSSKKPAAESGKAVLYTAPRAGAFLTTNAGISSATTTAHCVTKAVLRNTSDGMACHSATCSMKPPMNVKTDVLSTGRHSTRHAWENGSFSYTARSSGRSFKAAWPQTADTANSAAHSGTCRNDGAKAARRYTARLVRFDAMANT